MNTGKCPNCGAPMDLQKQECPYCNSKYSDPSKVIKKTNEGLYSQQATNSNKAGCLRALLSFGLFFLYSIMRRPRRR